MNYISLLHVHFNIKNKRCREHKENYNDCCCAIIGNGFHIDDGYIWNKLIIVTGIQTMRNKAKKHTRVFTVNF